MVIRLRLKLKSINGREVVVIALVNSGYETERPELLVPTSVARDLELYPTLPSGAEVREYILADGSRTRLIKIPSVLEVSVVTNDRVVGPVRCDVVIAEKSEEPLIGDKLSDALQIVAIAIGEGLWCFRDEIGKRTRRSEELFTSPNF
ncbi:MAG: hypothetical protein DRJ59_06300 [Thermoprotei archaeon]|nr:MAG: hypothetical protein DRJ59_06300 [Thermoprotei archaeon]